IGSWLASTALSSAALRSCTTQRTLKSQPARSARLLPPREPSPIQLLHRLGRAGVFVPGPPAGYSTAHGSASRDDHVVPVLARRLERISASSAEASSGGRSPSTRTRTSEKKTSKVTRTPLTERP